VHRIPFFQKQKGAGTSLVPNAFVRVRARRCARLASLLRKPYAKRPLLI
jgi:hypothetical protein